MAKVSITLDGEEYHYDCWHGSKPGGSRILTVVARHPTKGLLEVGDIGLNSEGDAVTGYSPAEQAFSRWKEILPLVAKAMGLRLP
jgi:hypothetical protein